MDDADGFFPERRILAMRRAQQRVSGSPPQSDKSKQSVEWFALSITFFCVFLPVALTLGTKGLTVTLLRPVLLAICYALAAFAVTGVVIGSYRGLRYSKRIRT